MDNNRFDKFRLPLAIILSSGVFFIYTQYVSLTTPNGGKKFESITNSSTTNRLSESQSALNPSNRVEFTPKSILLPDKKEQFYTLENKQIRLEFSTYNAVVTKSFLKNQKTKDGEYNLEAGGISNNNHTGLLSFQPNFKNDPIVTPYKVTDSGDTSITFVGKVIVNGQEVVVYKHYSLEGYRLALNVTLTSLSKTPINLQYYLFNGSSLGEVKNEKNQNTFDITTLSYTIDGENQNALKSSIFSSEDDYASSGKAVDWIAIDNRFYLRALSSTQKELIAEFRKETSPKYINYVSALNVPATITSASAAINHKYTFTFLPKNRDLLNDLSDATGLRYYLIYRHYLHPMKLLSDVLHKFLILINQYINSFGWSIIILTLLLKLVTYPLTQKSYDSMQKMQALNPKMEEIRKKYKKDPQKTQMEIMALYRKEKINPAMGCLPMMIPIPIFFALYSLFQNMTELNHISFLWIDNLAYSDNIATLSFSLPLLGNSVNLLPVLMAVSQFFQSALTPQTSNNEMAQAQAKMMKYFLPVFFLFICWNLPSALVLFWFINNVFSIFQTLLTKKKRSV